MVGSSADIVGLAGNECRVSHGDDGVDAVPVLLGQTLADGAALADQDVSNDPCSLGVAHEDDRAVAGVDVVLDAVGQQVDAGADGVGDGGRVVVVGGGRVGQVASERVGLEVCDLVGDESKSAGEEGSAGAADSKDADALLADRVPALLVGVTRREGLEVVSAHGLVEAVEIARVVFEDLERRLLGREGCSEGKRGKQHGCAEEFGKHVCAWVVLLWCFGAEW